MWKPIVILLGALSGYLIGSLIGCPKAGTIIGVFAIVFMTCARELTSEEKPREPGDIKYNGRKSDTTSNRRFYCKFQEDLDCRDIFDWVGTGVCDECKLYRPDDIVS